MQSKITLKRFRGGLRKTLMALGLAGVLAVSTKAQTYVNGNLGTGTVARNGSTAPTGFQWHEIQNDNGTTTIANSTLAVNVTGTYSLADDFTVPAGATWTITKFTSYFIQPTAGTVTAAYVRIYNGNPSAGGTVVYGDLTTNRLATTSAAGMYGVFNSLVPPTNPATTYPITQVDANVSTVLPAGTYWIQWQLVSGAATYSPTSQVVGVRSQPTYNAIQSTSGAWAAIVDGGVTAAGAAAGVNVPVELPFKLAYTSTGGTACTGTPAPGATIASVASVCPATLFTLSLTTPTTGIGVTYQWQSATTAAPTFTNIIGATASTLTYSQAAATMYRCQVTCGGNTGTSTPVTVAASTGCYCIPAAVNCTLDDQITNVTLDILNNSSTCGASGYTNYTTNTAIPIPSVIAGGGNPIKVTVGPGGTEYVGVWIDYNQNGVFETSEFQLLGSANGATISGVINAPATALLGNTRMRVRVQYNTAVLNTQACAATSAYGEVEDYTVNLVPCTPITITTQPASVSAACGSSTSFTVATTGSLPTYQWEYRTSATGLWQNVPNAAPYSGVTTNTLSISTVANSMTGYQYRAVVSGACSALDVSSAATLTVTVLPLAITPATYTKCISDVPVLISAPSTQTVLTFTNNTPTATGGVADGDLNGITRNVTVSGVAGPVLKVRVKVNATSNYIGDLVISLKAPNGKIINLDYLLNKTNNGPGGTPVGFVNTYFNLNRTVQNYAPYNVPAGQSIDNFDDPFTGDFPIDNQMATYYVGVPSGPTGYAANTTDPTSLYPSAASANGVWTLAMYDAGPPDPATFKDFTLEITYGGAPATMVLTPTTGLFTDAAGGTAYTGTAVTQVYANPAVSTTYSAVITSGACSTGAQNIRVNVHNPIVGTSTVNNATICNGGNTSFTASAPTSGNTIAHQWKVSTNGGVTYTNVANGGVYSGATTSTLTITGATSSMNGYKYKDSLYVTSCNSNIISSVGTLTVNATPQIVINVGPYTSLLPNLTTTLTAAVSPNAGATYTWYRNGVVVAGATGNRLVVGVDALGTYTASVADVNACGSAVSNAITITDSVSGKLYVYPSPNAGVFQVRYHAAAGNSLVRGLNIYDDKGARVYTQQYTQAAPYARMAVNMPLLSSGAYWAEVVDLNGNRLAVSKFVVQK